MKIAYDLVWAIFLKTVYSTLRQKFNGYSGEDFFNLVDDNPIFCGELQAELVVGLSRKRKRNLSIMWSDTGCAEGCAVCTLNRHRGM